MEKAIVKVQYKWNYLQWVMLASMMIFLLVLPVFAFDNYEPQWLTVLWFIFFGLFALACLLFAFIGYQIAELSDKGLILKCKLYIIKELKWSELERVRIEKLASGTAGLSIIYKEWIVLYTESRQLRNHGGVNKTKKGPWYIKFTEQNFSLIKEFCFKFNSNAVIMDK